MTNTQTLMNFQKVLSINEVPPINKKHIKVYLAYFVTTINLQIDVYNLPKSDLFFIDGRWRDQDGWIWRAVLLSAAAHTSQGWPVILVLFTYRLWWKQSTIQRPYWMNGNYATDPLDFIRSVCLFVCLFCHTREFFTHLETSGMYEKNPSISLMRGREGVVSLD